MPERLVSDVLTQPDVALEITLRPSVFADFTGQAKVKERLDDTYNDLGRSVRRAKAVAEDRLDDVRSHVKKRPLLLLPRSPPVHLPWGYSPAG